MVVIVNVSVTSSKVCLFITSQFLRCSIILQSVTAWRTFFTYQSISFQVHGKLPSVMSLGSTKRHQTTPHCILPQLRSAQLRVLIPWSSVILGKQTVLQLKNKKPTKYHLLIYCTSYRLNMVQALLCPSSGARDCTVDYHNGLFVLGLLWVGGQLRLGWSSVRAAPRKVLQPTANQERNDQCGNQHYSRELLMMGIVMPETC